MAYMAQAVPIRVHRLPEQLAPKMTMTAVMALLLMLAVDALYDQSRLIYDPAEPARQEKPQSRSPVSCPCVSCCHHGAAALAGAAASQIS
jgi:hypothetical protein